MSTLHYDCIIIGGGAAGLMCAATAAKRGRKTLILDHANKIGKKILMSGGGRCNFTNLFIDHDNYVSNNSHFFKSALSRYTQYDFLALVDSYNLSYHEKELGQLFCDNKARDILNILKRECETSGVTITTQCAIEKIQAEKKPSPTRFTLSTSNGVVSCKSLVVATGGLSIPTMGATGFGYEIAEQFGLKVLSQQASLVPFVVEPKLREFCIECAGVSMPVEIHCRNRSFTGPLLFTHKGISGPAILQISNYWKPGDLLSINLLPHYNLVDTLTCWRQEGKKSDLANLLAQLLPKRFSQNWTEHIFSKNSHLNKAITNLSNANIEEIAQNFHHWEFIPAGTEGYKTAEVTLGGVDTNELSSKTFEAKKCPDLYFIGEVIDVTGWLGGFNFQWAWASGYCAGEHI